ncbi:hypothetical protein EYZ11_006381 [Aspergillus tanneri]|uniref:Uncharacterized protein n=1 Tax=Aspergillus tanneri TaxID=1220188 RepID=A0A4S3JFY1_9EURO|nr:hypothetical protein EYZ11_006381 [Aspergillus tanneri]
MQLVEVPNQ